MPFVVLTGDLVSSSALSRADLDACMTTLETAISDVSGWAGWPGRSGDMITGFGRRGGDGWQAALCVPAIGLRAGLFLRARLRRDNRAHDTRIAIARGPGSLPPDGNTNAAHGPAFTASGRLLDTLTGAVGMADAAGGAHHAATLLADHISRGWTEAQARALCEMLPPDAGPRVAAAERLGISRQAVDQALHAAGFPALSKALDAIEHAADTGTDNAMDEAPDEAPGDAG